MVIYVHKYNHLKTKYVQYKTCVFFDYVLRSLRRPRKNCEKAYQKNANSPATSQFFNSVWSNFNCLPKNILANGLLIKHVKYSRLPQLLGKNNFVLLQGT